MLRLPWSPRRPDTQKPSLSLALQGGGSHGAFTWGVLDRLLEAGIRIDGISGTSAGAMNAVALAHGWTAGGADGARAALADFWQAVGDSVPFHVELLNSLNSTTDGALPTPMNVMMGFMRLFSPYQLNPFELNPLRDVVRAQFDFERLRRDPARLPEAKPEPEALTKALRPPLLQVFPPALLGRLVVVPYYPLSDDMLRSIVRLQLGRIKKRIADNHRIAFEWDDAVEQLIVARCTEGESGGRMVDAILTNTVLPEISGEMLQRMAAAKPFLRVQLRAASAAFDYQFD